ncbi:MAG: penicillin-binding protein 2, partial [Planctomycetota bacterium]
MKSVRTIIFFLLLLILAFLSLAGRCFYLQYFRTSHYLSTCNRQQQSYNIQKPQRGVILDCRGRILAASNKIQTIFAEPRIVTDPESLSYKLASIVNIDVETIYWLISESKNPGYAKIKVGAAPNQCRVARKTYGVGVESDWRRHYPAGTLTADVVGFTSTDNRGLGGIELKYDKHLAGSAGQNIFLADADRRPIRLKQQSAVLKDGGGIILTLDATIQQFAHQELLEQYQS